MVCMITSGSVRQDGRMPKVYVPSGGERPPDVEAAIQVLGSSARMEILRFVGENPDSFFGAIREALPGLASSSLVGNLRVLVDLGVLTTDLLPEERRGRSPRYSLSRERLRGLTESWFTYVASEGFEGPAAK